MKTRVKFDIILYGGYYHADQLSKLILIRLYNQEVYTIGRKSENRETVGNDTRGKP